MLTLALAAALALGFAPACEKVPLPGTTLGTYSVKATPASNTCGNGLGGSNLSRFTVEVSRADATVYWSYLDGSPVLEATLDAAGQAASGSTKTTVTVREADAAFAPCAVDLTTSFTFTLGAEPAPATITAKFTYAYAAAAGSDCSGELASVGGTFEALPCTTTYDLIATRKN